MLKELFRLDFRKTTTIDSSEPI